MNNTITIPVKTTAFDSSPNNIVYFNGPQSVGIGTTPGAATKIKRFIGGKADQPAPLSPREAAAILDRVAAGSEKATPKTVFEPGEIVRVTDGPFNDFNGVVEEVNYEKSRLRVAVTIFGRSTPVELDFGQVEKG